MNKPSPAQPELGMAFHTHSPFCRSAVKSDEAAFAKENYTSEFMHYLINTGHRHHDAMINRIV